jgi:hypothetical protein
MKWLSQRKRHFLFYLMVLVLWFAFGSYGVLDAPYVGF